MADVKYYDVILKPVITEKSMAGMGEKKYTSLRLKKLLKRCSKAQRLLK